MVPRIVEFEGRVTRVEKELIPKMHVARIEDPNGDYVVEMDLHEDLFMLQEGETVVFRVERELGEYRDGVDLVGRATVASMKKEGDRYAYLLSIGGLLVVIRSAKKLDLTPTEKVYVVVQPKKS